MELAINISNNISGISYQFGGIVARNDHFKLVSDFFFLQSQGDSGAVISSRLRFGVRRVRFDGLDISNVNEARVWGPSIDTFILIDTIRSALLSVNGVQCALDIGCGTGIIALWLAKLGHAKTVYGIDIESEAVDSARLNCRTAGLEDRVKFIERSMALLDTQERYPLIVCNPPYLPVEFHASDYAVALNGSELVRYLLANYHSFLTEGGRCFTSLSGIARLDPAVDKQLSYLANVGRARCIRCVEVPFFLETVLCDNERMERLVRLGGVKRHLQGTSPYYWHEVQIWELH